MNTSNIDLNVLYFKYKVLTKITGKPTFAKLHVLFRKLKSNTAAVPCTLAGGANGYLGMLVSAAQYQTVAPGTPFVPPPQPGALIIDPNDTQYQIMIAKTQYETALREHQTYVLLQRSLIALVQEAIETKYTNAIQNRITGQLPGDIRLLKNHLFSTYGKINEQELQAKYDETIKLSYSITDPIDDIFNELQGHEETCTNRKGETIVWKVVPSHSVSQDNFKETQSEENKDNHIDEDDASKIFWALRPTTVDADIAKLNDAIQIDNVNREESYQ